MPQDDPDPATTPRMSYAPGERVALHVSTTAAEWELEVGRDGVTYQPLLTKAGLPGHHRVTPQDCSVNGCDWPVSFEFTIPDDWTPGGYLVTFRARRGRDMVEEHHLFVLRSAGQSTRPNPATWSGTLTWNGPMPMVIPKNTPRLAGPVTSGTSRCGPRRKAMILISSPSMICTVIPTYCTAMPVPCSSAMTNTGAPRCATPSVDPWNAVVFGLRAHRGKGSIVLNLRSDDGQGVFWRLVAEADVVTMIRFGPTRRPSSPPPLGRLRRQTGPAR